MTRTTPMILTAALLLTATSLAPAAWADSIYLKNGRVIHASEARIEGDRVVIVMYGATQTIPLALVDRIEKNDESEPQVRAAGSDPSDDVSEQPGSAPASAGSLEGTPGERMQVLSELLVQSGVDPAQAAQALGVLQALGSSSAVSPADLNAQLGALDTLPGGGEGRGLEQAQALLPLLSQLGAALFAPEYSPDATAAAAENLLAGLRSMGVSGSQIEAQAQRLGLPPELLRQLRAR